MQTNIRRRVVANDTGALESRIESEVRGEDGI